MKAKHTPGPWRYQDCIGKFVIWGKTTYNVLAHIEKANGAIAKAEGGDSNEN